MGVEYALSWTIKIIDSKADSDQNLEIYNNFNQAGR